MAASSAGSFLCNRGRSLVGGEITSPPALNTGSGFALAHYLSGG